MIRISGWTLRSPSTFTRFILLALISIALMILDYQTHQLQKIRGTLDAAVYPIRYLAALPTQAAHVLGEFFQTKERLRRDYEQLAQTHLELRAKLQTYEALAADNERLRQLLDAGKRVSDRMIAAPLMEVGAEPFTRKLTIAKGSADDVYLGQPVLDAAGVVGQVTAVNAYTSHITLITDPSQSVPVQSLRSGVRAIVFGTGAHDRVEIPYLTASADIREGDVLVSSGLGGIFPPDYPVAQVVRIVNDPNEAFLKVIARPLAQLGHGREVLLVWPGDRRFRASGTRTNPTREFVDKK